MADAFEFHDMQRDLKALTASVEAMTPKLDQILKNQQDADTARIMHGYRIGRLEKVVYGILAVVVIAVVGAGIDLLITHSPQPMYIQQPTENHAAINPPQAINGP